MLLSKAMARWSTVLSGVFLTLSMVLCLGKLLMLAVNENNGDLTEADLWLAEIDLIQHRPLFHQKGKKIHINICKHNLKKII